MSDLRVLFVTGEYPPMRGGVGDYTANLRLALAAMGTRTIVLSARGASGEDVRTVRGWGWLSPRRVMRIARRDEIDVVHIQYQAGAFAMHPALNVMPSIVAKAVPVVTTFHDLRVPYLFPKAGRFRKSAILRMARGSDAVFVTNPADARALDKESVGTIQIPIGPNIPPPGPNNRPVWDVVAFFGYPARSKGIVDLIQALALIDDRQVTLLLVGDQGTPGPTNDIVSTSEIDRLANQTGVVVRRTGYLSPREASETLAQSTVVAMPFNDGASLRSGSLLAALQTGRPVVTTAPRAIADLGELNGMPQLLLVQPGHVEEFATAIQRALDWSGSPAPLPATHRWQMIATAHADVYQQVTSDRRR